MSLARASWGVLRRDLRLLLLPVMSGLASLVVAIGILAPAVALRHAQHSNTPLYPAVVIEIYALTFIATYFGVAFAAIVNAELDGRRPTLSDGFAAANARLGAIGWWTFVAGTVGILIRAIRVLPWMGDVVEAIVAGVLGFVWGATTFFVVPVLALEGRSAKDAVQRSVQVIRERWGEGAVGFVSITAALVIALAPLFLVLWIAALALSHSAPVVLAVVVLATFVGIALLILAETALQQVFRIVLFRYATGQGTPAGFDESQLQSATRRRRGLFGRG